MNFTVKTAKANFFDRDKIVKAIGKARANVGNRQGALVRKIMRQSMKKKKGPAPAGSPPNVHEGGIKDKTYYAWDKSTQSVVVGPVKLGKGNAPEIQDKGGTVFVSGIYNHRGDFVPLFVMTAKGRIGAVASGKVVKIACKVEARPFSEPALKAAKKYMAEKWKGAVK